MTETLRTTEQQPALNTDRELWREREGDYYADSIHVTADGKIGINHDGYVYTMSLREWHARAEYFDRYRRLQAVLFEFKDALEHSHR